MINSRDPRDLHPELAALYEQFAAKCKTAGIDFILTCTYRDDEAQMKLFNSGRNTPGPILTHAGPGQSAHNCKLNGKPAAKAFDVCVMEHGKPQWQTQHPHWSQMGNIGEFIGLEWAGHWRTFKEFPHFQLKGWKPDET